MAPDPTFLRVPQALMRHQAELVDFLIAEGAHGLADRVRFKYNTRRRPGPFVFSAECRNEDDQLLELLKSFDYDPSEVDWKSFDDEETRHAVRLEFERLRNEPPSVKTSGELLWQATRPYNKSRLILEDVGGLIELCRDHIQLAERQRQTLVKELCCRAKVIFETWREERLVSNFPDPPALVRH